MKALQGAPKLERTQSVCVMRSVLAAAVAVALWIAPAIGQPAPEASSTSAATSQKSLPASYQGFFRARMLAGGSTNELEVPVEATRLPHLPAEETIKWLQGENAWSPRWCSDSQSHQRMSVLSKAPVAGDNSKTLLSVSVPPPPCWWPLSQVARITIKGHVAGSEGMQTFFDASVHVSVFWFPFLTTIFAVALIYPGCAITFWYMRQRQYKRGLRPKPPASFVSALDPVQITSNLHGRASLAKLQIFLFTMIVFGMLLFFQLRCGILAGMSADILALLGISAVGAAGGKMTYTHKRRLSIGSWAWLHRKGWLWETCDIAERAKWSELLLDSDTKEFDAYSFQMAVFSLVVAVALIGTSLSGLGTFKIPAELLALLGISQVVFIGGKAVDKSAFNELDKAIEEVRNHEAKYNELNAKAGSAKQTKAALNVESQAALKALETSVIHAAEVFAAVYRERLPENTKLDVDALVESAKRDLPGHSAAVPRRLYRSSGGRVSRTITRPTGTSGNGERKHA